MFLFVRSSRRHTAWRAEFHARRAREAAARPEDGDDRRRDRARHGCATRRRDDVSLNRCVRISISVSNRDWRARLAWRTEIERVVGAERFDAGQGAVRTDIGFFDDFDDDFDERAIRGDVAVAAEERRDGASSE